MEWRAPRLTKKVLGIEHCLQQIAHQRQKEAMHLQTVLNNGNQADDLSNTQVKQTEGFSTHIVENDISANDVSRESTQMADLVMLSERYQHLQNHQSRVNSDIWSTKKPSENYYK